MNKTSKIKKSLITFIIIIASLFTSKSTAQAVYFSGWQSGPSALWNSKTFYCIEHQDGFTGGTWNPISSTEVRSDDPSQSNRALAYILRQGIVTGNGGYNGRGTYQIAVWKWYYSKGINTRDPGYSSLYETAKGVKSIPYSNNAAAITTSSNYFSMTGLTGAIKLKSLTGNVSKIRVEWKDLSSNKTYTKYISSSDSGLNDWITFYSDKECKTKLKVKDLKNGTFYFKNMKENYLIKNVTIYVEAKSSGYSVTVTRYRKSNGDTSEQDLISPSLKEGKSYTKKKVVTAKYDYGKIKLVKQGSYKDDGKDKKENVKATFKIYCSTLGKWVSGDAAGNKKYVDNIKDATEYSSGTTVNKLFATYNYEVAEVSVNNKYYNNPINMTLVTSSKQGNLSISTRDSYKSAPGVKIYKNETNTVTVTNERTAGDLIIKKIDKNKAAEKINGAKVKIYVKDNGWLIKNSDGTYAYNGTKDTATPFTINNGELKIECVKFATYYVYETDTPEGYDKTKQDGYMNKNGKDPYTFSKDNEWVYLGEANLNENDNIVEFTAENEKIISIEGTVWLDNPGTKLDEYNHKLDGNDELLEGIVVNLYDKNGKDPIATTTTDSKGHYKFENIDYWDVQNYYVEFEYDNTKYITVTAFTGSDAESSKAQEYTVTADTLDDEKLTGNGRAVTYRDGADNNKKLLTDFYDTKTYTIGNINLGLIEKHVPQYSIKQELDHIKVFMNGYNYTYNYLNTTPNYVDANGNTVEGPVSPYVPTTSAQTATGFYTAQVYPSDIAYSFGENTGVTPENKLKLYVVYKITVNNDEKYSVDPIYDEQKLHLTSLTNEFDGDRYILSTEKTGGQGEEQFDLWTSNESVATYNLNNDKNAFKDGITKGNQQSTYIQFQMKDEALKAVLKGETNIKDEINNKPTRTTVNAYHDYLRTDSIWKQSDVKSYTGANTNGYNDNKLAYTHKSLSKEAKSYALYVHMKLGDSRTISGTVFEDNKVEGADLGNGVYDNENIAKNVTVDLLNASDKNITDLYKQIDTSPYYESSKATTVTDGQGKYSFVGVVPGVYYIRFTYGDGTQKIVDTNGNEIDVKLNDYKSTIISEDIRDTVKAANDLSNDEITNAINTILSGTDENAKKDARAKVEWYKSIKENKVYSIATDDLELRRTFDDNSYSRDGTIKDNDNKKDVTTMNAYTPAVSISIENDAADEGTVTGNSNDYHKNVYDRFNLGIIKVPQTVVTLSKKMTNVNVTSQVGNTLVSENPYKSNSVYLSDLEKAKLEAGDIEGSAYAKFEIDPSIIYGADLDITYSIKISNDSEIDYIDESGDFFKYGIKNADAPLKTVTIEEVNDYVDEKFEYDESQTIKTDNGKEITVSVIKEENVNATADTSTDTTEEPDGVRATATTTKKYLQMSGFNEIAIGGSEEISYVVNAKINSSEDDLTYNNDAEVETIKLDKLTTLRSDFKWEDSKDSTVFAITAPTGENRDNLYWTAGAIALAVLASGIIVIKKKLIK